MYLSTLKYPGDLYVDSGFFNENFDAQYTRMNESLVRCSKPHLCVGNTNVCKKEIKRRDYAVRVTVLFRSEGFKSCYICTSCIEQWLEESGQVKGSEDLNDGS